ncbi:MAG: aminotransferase class I/II-fold pyridoxal phosphate-dependent enzyme [Pelosinus sp.]|nr:aminotransferase class I/II-fold pyridoxal phosphate-dependent enzyme [Pelosinus sp.]
MISQAVRMESLSSSIFSEVDELRKAEIAAGKSVITLSIGSPDLPPAPHIIEALNTAAISNQNYGYTLSKGTDEFLMAAANWYKQKFNVTLNPETEVHSLLGSQDGLAHLALCMVNPGDIVLVPDPGYPIFSVGPLMAGAELYKMPLLPENNYLPDLKAIDKDILRRAKLMILNYPNNPLAATASSDFFAEVVALAHEYSFVVCHDFAYSELVFDGYRPASFLATPGAKEIGIEFHSLSKTYNMAGCRVAFAVGNAQVLSLLGKLKSNFDYGIFYPLQKAGVAALTGSQECVRNTAMTYQQRRDIIVKGFNNIGWHVASPQATMFVWAPVPTKQTSFDFVVDLLQHTGVAVVPGSAFGACGDRFIRIALVQPNEILAESVLRIKNWLG